jgi:CheY-like chemotaxis protein
VHVTGSVHDTLRLALDHDPDLVVLDLAIPGFDSLEACRQLRSMTDAYLVVLSARQRILDAIGEPVAAAISSPTPSARAISSLDSEPWCADLTEPSLRERIWPDPIRRYLRRRASASSALTSRNDLQFSTGPR